MYNGVQVGHANNWNTANFSKNTQTFRLFRGRTQGGIDFGHVRLIDGDIVVRDYYPSCKNGHFGFYDLANDKFYGNDGTGEFLHGDVIACTNRVRIEAVPYEMGEPDPYFGYVDGVQAGELRTFTAPSGEVVYESEVYTCTGYDVYRWDADNLAFEAEPYLSGSGTVCPYQHPNPAAEAKVVWKFAKNAVSVSANGPGTATAVRDGDDFVLTATPQDQAEFLFWRGEAVPAASKTNATLRIPATQATAPFVAWFRWKSGGHSLVRTWNGGDGLGDDTTKWTPTGVPTANDDIVIPTGLVDVKDFICVNSLTVGTNGFFRFAASGEPNYASMAWPDSGASREINVLGSVTNYGRIVIGGRAVNPGTDICYTKLTVNVGGNLALLADSRTSVAATPIEGDVTFANLYASATKVAVGGAIDVGETAILYPICDHLTGASVKFTAASFSLAEGASVVCNDRGWQNFRNAQGGDTYLPAPSRDNGRGIFTYARTGSGYDHAIGAGYGGRGYGNSQTESSNWGQPYGYAYAPFLPGAPGGGDGNYTTSYDQRGGQIRGGGVFWLWATGAVRVDGKVTANAYKTGCTAASGGGIWIAGKSLAFGENAALEAKGANDDAFGSHCTGGGGRISIAYNITFPELEELALGGDPQTHIYKDEITLVSANANGGEITSGGRAGDGTCTTVYNAEGQIVHVAYSGSVAVTGCDPDYSDYPILSGTEVTFNAPEYGYYPGNETWRYECLGFVLSNATEQITNGTARQLVYTVGHEDLTLVWQWGIREFGHPVAKPAHGAIEADGVLFSEPGTVWSKEGATLALRAVPEDGAEFLYWIGDIPWTQVTNATIALEPSEQRNVRPVFRVANAPTAVTWKGGDGDWNDESNWQPANVPGRGDDVTVAAGTCRVDQCAFAGSLALSGAARMSATPVQSTTYRKNVMMAVTRDLTLDGAAGLCFGNTNAVANVYNTVAHDLSVGGDLSLAGASVLSLSGGRRTTAAEYRTGTARLTVGGNFSILGTAQYRPNSDGYYGGSVQATVGGRFTLGAAARVDANRLGYGVGASGGGTGYGDLGKTAASHGGRGTTKASAEAAHVPATAAYDYAYCPREPGQTSRHAGSGLVRGGGAVRIVANDMRIDGTLTADGGVRDGDPSSTAGGGASSGGTICLMARRDVRFGAAAVLSAKGASSATNPYLGASGGGRVAVGERLTDAQYAALLASPAVLPAGVVEDGTAYVAARPSFADAVAPGDAARDLAACWGSFTHLTGTAKPGRGLLLLVR